MRNLAISLCLSLVAIPAIAQPKGSEASRDPTKATTANIRESKAAASSRTSRRPADGSWDTGPLGSQAAQLMKIYARHGEAHRLEPRFVEQSEALPIAFDPALTDPATEGCLTLVALGSPNLAFLLVFDEQGLEPARRAWPVPSAAGTAEITRCGARKPLLESLSLKLRSRRGVVEFIAVLSEQPPPPIGELLPGRNPGPSPPSPQIGRPPWLAPLAERIEITKRRIVSRGGRLTEPSGLSADDQGRGSTEITLQPGCHRIVLLGESNKDAPPDLDARLFTLTRGEQLETDEEHSSHATLTHCVGRVSRLHLDFSGAVPGGEVTLLLGSWDLPEAIPLSWGPHSRARLSRALFDDGIVSLGHTPAFASLGVRGRTRTIFETDPEGCYIAAIATIQGDAPSLTLSVESHGKRHRSTEPEAGHGASVAFCANGADLARLQVQVGGSGLAWILGIWSIEAVGTPE